MTKYKVRPMAGNVMVYYKITNKSIFTISVGEQLGLANRVSRAKFDNFADEFNDSTEEAFENAKLELLKLLDE